MRLLDEYELVEYHCLLLLQNIYWYDEVELDEERDVVLDDEVELDDLFIVKLKDYQQEQIVVW